MALIDELLKPRVNPFPRNAAGALVNPDYVQTEGQRIRDSLGAGTFGNQPIASRNATVATPAIAVAPVPELTEFSQEAWNQSPGQLRRDLNLDILRTTAAQRKLDLEQSRTNAPVLNAYDQAKLEHELAATAAIGATETGRLQRDARSMKHIAGFSDYMVNAPEEGTPEFDTYVKKGIVKFPGILNTKWGAQHLPLIGKTHDTIAGLKSQLPEGFNLTSVTVGANGKPSVTMKPTDLDAELEKAAKGYGVSLDQVRNPIGAEVGRKGPDGAFVGDEKGDIVRINGPDNKKVSMSVKEYQRLGGTFSPEGATKRGAAPAIDLTELARKALNDPKATDAEKAAARKRLGQ